MKEQKEYAILTAEISKRDKNNLDIFWIKDKSLEDSDDLPDPAILAREIASRQAHPPPRPTAPSVRYPAPIGHSGELF